MPVFIPYTQDAATLDEYAALDGFLYAGGVDVDPAKYGETVLNDTVEIDAERDAFEFALWERIYPAGKPIFGICRGIQSINVALGGSLYQDIPDHHQTEPREPLRSMLRSMTAGRFTAYSAAHRSWQTHIITSR
ncbi:MAG: gamma-glutamyl-gamma-aminobutyrate hydrolase family protein [Eubacteriales bacterium]